MLNKPKSMSFVIANQFLVGGPGVHPYRSFPFSDGMLFSKFKDFAKQLLSPAG